MRYKDEVLRVLDTMNNDLQILIKAVEEKLDTLIGVIQKGGIINMDGQKVGEVVALALNTTGG